MEAADRFTLPLAVAVTGHRDLVKSEIPALREHAKEFLSDLRDRFPNRQLSILSGLAEGADRLVADVAIELGISLAAVLPMPIKQYEADFQSQSSLDEFHRLCAAADQVLELPIARDSTLNDIAQDHDRRNWQYAQLGVFLCAHCHILLALWDGRYTGRIGGTGEVVKFHHDDHMQGFTSKSLATQQMLVDDESDLVYHLVCSRDREDGAPPAEFSVCDGMWFTKDRHEPRTKDIPAQHQSIFARSGEFSADARQYSERIAAEKYSLASEEKSPFLPDGIESIDRLFGVADWLAIHYQKKTLTTLQAVHALAFLMGMMFMMYSDFDAQTFYMIAFLTLFGLAALVRYVAQKRAWQRKYLDYRALAEGLRVQFYWAAAGVNNENESKFTHDNFLQAQDPELGWIRNVMRVAGLTCDAKRQRDPAGLAFAIDEWIGDRASGQLGYYRKKSRERVHKKRFTDRLGLASLLVSVAVVLVLVITGNDLPEELFSPLMILMGALLLAYAIRQGYAYSTAESELIKQYEFMLRIFHNARRRLDAARDAGEQRQVLQALGGSALDEHAEWILMHRERSIEQDEIWQVST